MNDSGIIFMEIVVTVCYYRESLRGYRAEIEIYLITADNKMMDNWQEILKES